MADQTTTRLTSTEAAARLGIKKETLYAYVSRRLLDRTLSLDGRSSLFDARQIDELRRTRRRSAQGELRTVITTGITELDHTGHRHRGLSIDELVSEPFESVADLIWQHRGTWAPDPDLVVAVHRAIDALPTGAPALDRMRVAVVVASCADPMRSNPAPAAHAQAGRAMLNAAVAALDPSAATDRDPAPGVASRALRAFTPGGADLDEKHQQVMNRALILLADHGLAASTFSARIAASVRADPYSIVSAGLGPVGGVLHGAASLAVHRLFLDAELRGPTEALGAIMAAGESCPGVGHTVYRTLDPRDLLLTDAISVAWADDPRLDIVDQLRREIADHIGVMTNIDFALGAMTWLLNAPPWTGEALFALARIVGWVAHGIEEFTEPPLRFRPTARYVPTPSPETLATPD